ncbi:DEAD/DEAH box helicase [Gallicola sp. Sow4_E12]|uniref:DEAD/DEAH box helicase n=1 Tax=Gallicola sp. Sow4_E12 TaxID=3438785 RepID=UPI003F8E9252
MTKERFEELNLSKEVLDAVSDMGFEEMSPIQAQAIPYLMEGEDVIGQAQTGTGKTAAFGIPIVEQVDPTKNAVQAIVLCPTRELCIQVSQEISKLAKYKQGIRVLPIYGGQPIDRQIRSLKKGIQIVIGTPGRVMDHIRRKTLKLDDVRMFVLDEADEMFDMGFREDIEFVLNYIPGERQSLFFSATMAPEILRFAKKYQAEPKIVKIQHKEMTVPKVDQFYYELKSFMKSEILSRVLDIYNPKLSVVFCNTKRMVDELTTDLQSRGYFADGLHGDLKQTQRDVVMNKFRKGTIDILVATDVAARGIDVDDVDLVVNYDIPQDNEYYVHRIGRTARAGREGTAISFVTSRDYNNLRDIQKYTKTTIERKLMPTLKDIRENQDSKTLNELRRIMDHENLENQIKTVSFLEAEEYSASQIAAAILKLYQNNTNLTGHKELDYVDINTNKKLSRSNNRDGRDRDRRGNDRRRGDKRKSNSFGKSKRLYFNVGRRVGISQRHILSAICKDAGVKASDVGNIDIYDKFTFVDVNPKVSDTILKKLKGGHIKGSKVNIELAENK